MANTFKLKRSAVPGKVPVVGDLELGELGLNTYDGKLYTKKNVSGTESIVELSAGSGIQYTYSATAPASPNTGDEWTDSDTGITYKYLDDGDTSQWFEFGTGPSGIFAGDITLGDQSDLRFAEANANGSNYVAFQAPASIASDVTWTLPATDAAVSGYALVSDGAGTLSWAAAGGGATGGGTDKWAVEHDNTITTSYTISSGKNVISCGPLTVQSGAVVTVPSGSSWSIV